jgi:hypothetical protein
LTGQREDQYFDLLSETWLSDVISGDVNQSRLLPSLDLGRGACGGMGKAAFGFVRNGFGLDRAGARRAIAFDGVLMNS